AAHHLLRLGADREHRPVVRVDRDDRGFVEHDPLAAHVDQRVRRSEVHRDVTADDRHAHIRTSYLPRSPTPVFRQYGCFPPIRGKETEVPPDEGPDLVWLE